MPYRTRLMIAMSAGCISACIAFSVCIGERKAAAQEQADRKSGDPNPAVNAPDRFAWQTFIAINAPADNKTNDALWETWATDQETFPKAPDPKNPPKWPGRDPRPKDLVASTQFRQLNKIRRVAVPEILPDGNQEEVRRNKPAFDYIVANDLWHLNGLTKAFTNGTPVTFPVEATEIKAQWKKIDAGQKARYHWNSDQTGQLFGLIALHISSKALPNWFWATFEHVDNPNRGKDLGYHDSFGTVPPNSKDGKPSPALLELFSRARLGPEWQNYRLDGSQTEFIDSTGQFTRMGNSIIENGLVAKSSCINCHAMARVNATVVGDFDFVVGIPDKNMFFFSDGKLKNLQLDFVWGFSFAQPLPTPPSNP